MTDEERMPIEMALADLWERWCYVAFYRADEREQVYTALHKCGYTPLDFDFVRGRYYMLKIAEQPLELYAKTLDRLIEKVQALPVHLKAGQRCRHESKVFGDACTVKVREIIDVPNWPIKTVRVVVLTGWEVGAVKIVKRDELTILPSAMQQSAQAEKSKPELVFGGQIPETKRRKKRA